MKKCKSLTFKIPQIHIAVYCPTEVHHKYDVQENKVWSWDGKSPAAHLH